MSVFQGQPVRQRRPWVFEGGYSVGLTGSLEFNKAVLISATDIVGTTAGQLGHANGFPLVPAPGAGFVVELISAFLFYRFATAAYTAGGNLTVNFSGGGAAVTGLISAANSLAAGADKYVQFNPLAAAAANVAANVGLNLVSSIAFTQPGTAAGTVKVITRYRVHQVA